MSRGSLFRGASSYENRHVLAGVADVTSSVITLKPASVHGPNEVTIATSVASRPRAVGRHRHAPDARQITYDAQRGGVKSLDVLPF